MTKSRLSEKWIKASVLGTIWAASEIVLGSFLHNLKIPFTGNILTAIGIIILISFSYAWNEKGLFWRSGIICALLKTMSPSAVIFGPMIAIFTESVLLETSVRIFGRTYAGFLIGSMLAMSWNLFQKILNLIIFYGSDIIDVYRNLLEIARKQLNIQSDITWTPIFILLAAYALFGLAAAVAGIIIGKRIKDNPAINDHLPEESGEKTNRGGEDDKFGYSGYWLAANILLVISSLLLLSYTSLVVWGPAIILITIVWAMRYRRAIRQLSKPKFWFFFVFLTLLTAIVFSRAETGAEAFRTGVLTGLEMNFRALAIIIGFTAIGQELYNPVIRNFFLRTSFRNLPLAMEISVKSLPSVIANIPDFRSFIRNPLAIVKRVISDADRRLREIRNTDQPLRKIFIISGAVGEGKTTFARNMLRIFSEKNIPAGGILLERVMGNNHTEGYDLTEIGGSHREVFLRRDGLDGMEKIGRYSIYPEGLKRGIEILKPSMQAENIIVVIDEVGILELSGRGWSESLDELLMLKEKHLILIVRDSLTDEVIKKWNLAEAKVFRVSEYSFADAGREIADLLRDG